MAAAVTCVRSSINKFKFLANVCYCGKNVNTYFIGTRNFSIQNNVSPSLLIRRYPKSKTFQVANYYVKEKPKDPHAPSSKAWAAIGGMTCGLLISAIAYLGKNLFLNLFTESFFFQSQSEFLYF